MIEPTKTEVDWDTVDFSAMSVDDRMTLIGRIWESLDSKDVPPSNDQIAELKRRREEARRNPEAFLSREEVESQTEKVIRDLQG